MPGHLRQPSAFLRGCHRGVINDGPQRLDQCLTSAIVNQVGSFKLGYRFI
jgi:hypothetical protein